MFVYKWSQLFFGILNSLPPFVRFRRTHPFLIFSSEIPPYIFKIYIPNGASVIFNKFVIPSSGNNTTAARTAFRTCWKNNTNQWTSLLIQNIWNSAIQRAEKNVDQKLKRLWAILVLGYSYERDNTTSSVTSVEDLWPGVHHHLTDGWILYKRLVLRGATVFV